MKANAPEKLYYAPYGDIREDYSITDNDIEYVRKDAFIEKACSWLSNMSIENMEYKYDNFDTSEGWYKMIEDFRRYMEE